MVKDYGDSLIRAFNGWLLDKSAWQDKLNTQLEKIVADLMQKNNLKLLIKDSDDFENLKQSLLVFCFKKILPKVKPGSTNKQLYFYLVSSLNGRIKDKKKRMGRKLKTVIVKDLDIITAYSHESADKFYLPDFNSARLNELAKMLVEKYTRKEIMAVLGVGEKTLRRLITELKSYYLEAV